MAARQTQNELYFWQKLYVFPQGTDPTFREYSVAFRERCVAFREHCVAFREHSVAFREHSLAYRANAVFNVMPSGPTEGDIWVTPSGQMREEG